jgi:hypothetical protein
MATMINFRIKYYVPSNTACYIHSTEIRGHCCVKLSKVCIDIMSENPQRRERRTLF